MQGKIRFALLGCGRVAQKHLAALRDMDEAELAYVVDPAPEAARQQVAKYYSSELASSLSIFPSFEEALGQKNNPTDVVSITTPSGLHAQQAIKALEEGYHVLLEKPMALSSQDCQAILEAQKKAGKTVGLCHIYRYFPLVPDLREQIARGAYGKLLHAEMRVFWGHDEAYYRQGAWRGTWELDGGALMNQTVHAIDLLYWLVGEEAKTASAQLRRAIHQGIEAEDFGFASGELQSGASYSLLGTTASDPRAPAAEFDLLFHGGRLLAGIRNGKPFLKVSGKPGASYYYGRALNELLFGTGAPTMKRRFLSLTHPHHAVYEDFLQALREHREPRTPAEAGLRSVEAILAFYQAGKEEKTLQLPLTPPLSTEDFQGWSPKRQ